MSIFRRKSSEEKAVAKAAKQDRKNEHNAKRKIIEDRLSKLEKFEFGGSIGVVADELYDDEIIHFAATGKLTEHESEAVLIATDQRLILGWMKGISIGQSEIRYNDIDQIDTGMTVSGKWIHLRHGFHKTALEKSMTKDLDRLKKIVRERQETSSFEQGSPNVEVSPTDELAKLADLHASGVLTDEEFSAAKAKALGL